MYNNKTSENNKIEKRNFFSNKKLTENRSLERNSNLFGMNTRNDDLFENKNLSNDKVGIKPVIVDCIKRINLRNTFFFLIYATNPLLNYKNLQNLLI